MARGAAGGCAAGSGGMSAAQTYCARPEIDVQTAPHAFFRPPEVASSTPACAGPAPSSRETASKQARERCIARGGFFKRNGASGRFKVE